MLIIVIAKPTLFTSVIAVPFSSGVARNATSVLKRGESPITTIPQKTMKARNKGRAISKPKGDSKQQHPESSKKVFAIF